jgi:hypothetical protein
LGITSAGGSATKYWNFFAANVYTDSDLFFVPNSTALASAVLRISNGGVVTLSNSTAGSSGAGALVVTGGLATGAASYFGGAVSVGNTIQATAALNQLYLVSSAGTGLSSSHLISFFDSTGSSRQAYIYKEGTSGKFVIGNDQAGKSIVLAPSGSDAVTVTSTAATFAGTVIHTLSATPASASATGTVGTMSWDASYIYICTATNTWKRVAIATW